MRAFLLFLVLLAGIPACCFTASSEPQDQTQTSLDRLNVIATDESNAAGRLPTGPVEVHLVMTAMASDGSTDTNFAGLAQLSPSTGVPLTVLGGGGVTSVASTGAATNPTVQFRAGEATADLWVVHVFGETVFQATEISSSGNAAFGISNPICYGYPTIASVQANLSDAAVGTQIAFGEVSSLDAGACAPPTSNLIVTAVGGSFFVVADLAAYNPDSGLPNPGLDPNTGARDLPGSWGSLYVYTYDAPGLFIGSHLLSLSGTLGGFAGNLELDTPTMVTSPSAPELAALPNPLPVSPGWCSPQDPSEQPSAALLCDTQSDTQSLALASLDSSLISIANATLPTRWLDCDLNGTGEIPYRTSAGCMPQTNGNFCGEDAGTSCAEGQDCVANECLAECQGNADCPATAGNVQTCIDGHCQNACLCRAYCDSLDGCSELSEFNTSGQYDVTFPGVDGGLWKFGAVTDPSVPTFHPFSNPGMVVDFTNGFLMRQNAGDPPWLIVTRLPSDLCCVNGSPGCNTDAGVALCP